MDCSPAVILVKRAEMLIPRILPLYIVESCSHLKPYSASVFRPKGSCVSTELLRPQPKRNSLTTRAPIVRVQPMAADCPFMNRRPLADELVPSMIPPKMHGTYRKRFELEYRTNRLLV